MCFLDSFIKMINIEGFVENLKQGNNNLQLDARRLFYHKSIDALIKDKQASILVCGGGQVDKEIFIGLGFVNVTISNLDIRMQGNEYTPYNWSFNNFESLSFADEFFDYVVVHEAIHHVTSPHRALTEMYRVAKKGVLGIESNDSLTMRFIEISGFTQTYEHAAVYYHDGKFGGVNNTEIPNYIYRWTERELEKTINSYAPEFKHEFIYKYGNAFPCTPELEKKGKIKKYFLKFASPIFRLFVTIFPKQQNLYCFFIKKPKIDSLWPWLVVDKITKQIVFNKEWARKKYR